MATENKRMRQLNATEPQWTSANPVLLDGETAYSSDIRKYKVGNGVDTWAVLPYWGGSLDDAPSDGYTYGRQNGDWNHAVGLIPQYTGDLDFIPTDGVQMVELVEPITNGWMGVSTGDAVLDIYNATSGTRVQVGYSYSQDSDTAAVVHTRMLRGSWTEWTTSPVFLQSAYAGDLDTVTSASAYSAEIHTAGGVQNGWTNIRVGSVVKHINIDSDNAMQIGWDVAPDADGVSVIWMRKKEAGVWGPWNLPSVTEAQIYDLDRMRWRGTNWVQGQISYINDVWRGSDWTTICIAEDVPGSGDGTVDDPTPRRDYNEIYDMPDVPVWTTPSHNGVVESGRAWISDIPFTLVGYEVWIPTLTADVNYVVRMFSYPADNPSDIQYNEIAEPVLNEDQWTTISVSQQLVGPGQVIGLVVNALNSGSNTTITGGWGRAANNNTLTIDPGTGNWGTNNAQTSLRISYTDLDTTDRTTELQGIIAGTTAEFVQTDDTSKSISWVINATGADQTTHISFANVTLNDTGPNGAPDLGAVCTINILVPVPSPTDYVELVGGNPTFASGTAQGILRFDGVDQPGADANAYGVRILMDTWTWSDKFQVVALSGGGGGGGGSGGGGAANFTELADTPNEYLAQAGKAAIVNQAETGLEFGEAGRTDFIALDDTPFDYSGATGYQVVVNGTEDGLIFQPAQSGADPTTVGMVAAFPTDTVPAGWLVCDGSEFDGNAYPHLGAYLGGTTLPDMQDMFLKGATPDLPGVTGGAKETILTEGQLPPHGHDSGTLATNSTGSHSHSIDMRRSNGTYGSNANIGNTQNNVVQTGASTNSAGNHSHTVSGSVADTGNGDPIDNQPQHYVVVWAIRAVPTDPNDPAGATSFLELTDTPVSYTGQAGKIPTVNGTEDGLEFGDPPAQNFIGLTDTPADYTGQAGKFAQVATEEDRLIFEAITSGATVGDTFPLTPQAGQLHFKTGKHIGLYIWYEDGSSSQWVQTNGGGLDLIDEPYKVVHVASSTDFTDYNSTTTTSYAANGSRCYYVPKYKNTHVRITGESYWRNNTNGVDDWDIRGQTKHYDGAIFIPHEPQMNGSSITGTGTRLQFRITNTNTTTDGDVYTTPEPFRWWFPPGYGRIINTSISPNGHEVVYPLIGFSGSYAGTKYLLQTNFYIEEVMIRDTSDISFTYNAPNDRVEQPDYPNWES